MNPFGERGASDIKGFMGHAQDNQSFGNYSDGLVFEELKLAINRVDWSLH